MTRTSQDDLLTAKNLLIHYIDFLLTRAEQQTHIIKCELSSLRHFPRWEDNDTYINLYEKKLLDSTNEYSEFLLETKRSILNFFESNHRPLPLYSKETYRETLQLHRTEIERTLDSLLKDLPL